MPEDGVTRYQDDHTHGPACAIAAGAATIHRNYFVPVGGARGQTKDRQLDGLADLGSSLSAASASQSSICGGCGTGMRCIAEQASMRYPII
jgi:hypothetical protein